MADSKKYDGSQWEHSLRKMTTATAEMEPTIYTDGTAITSYTIKGNTVQNGTPTPSNPVPVVGVGELETTGEHSGEYKIPILSGGVTTPIYLSEQLMKIGDTADSLISAGTVTYNIKMWVLTGQEDWNSSHLDVNLFALTGITDFLKQSGITCISTHYQSQDNVSIWSDVSDKRICFHYSSASNILYVRDSTYATVTDFKAFLAAQYSAGTPVTVYYVLATPTTETITAPSIPITEGSNSITVDTTVQPSEFTATWTGWHNASVKEWDGSDWQ